MAGALSRMVGRAARRVIPPERGGALSRVSPQVPRNSRTTTPLPVKNNHMVSSTDSELFETGEGLRKLVGKIASRGRVAAKRGGPIRRAEGGKVSSAMSALKHLAKKYQEALDSGDTALARRLKRDYDLKRRDSARSGEVTPADLGETAARKERIVGNEKAATFSKGGKVGKLMKAFRARMDDREGYIREGFGATREEAHANLRKEVAHDNGEDVADAVMKEHGVTYSRRKK